MDLLRPPPVKQTQRRLQPPRQPGSVKLFGQAMESQDLKMRRQGEGLDLEIGMGPEGSEYRLFSLNVESIASVEFNDEKITRQLWKAD